ncbi:MAG: flagellar export chaperone FliS [Firmicutes bacterium]|nr:flagellar export chaperone FliS [Bacillota bacterium]
MYQNNAYNTYQNNKFETASQNDLYLMLYDGAIKFLKFSIIAMDDKDIENTNKNLIKVQNILNQLMNTINFDAGEIATNLYNLYEYMKHELIDANIKKDKEKIKMIKEMIEELRETWAKAMNKT